MHEWRLRSNPGYLREQVFLRDRGVCALCGSNATSAFLKLKCARGANRRALLMYWGLKKLSRRTLWDADHVLPVTEGGGECDLENIRTLCLRCHRKATQDLRARLTARKADTAAVN